MMIETSHILSFSLHTLYRGNNLIRGNICIQ